MAHDRTPSFKSDVTVEQSSNSTVPLVAVASTKTSGDFTKVIVRAVADDHKREQTIETSDHHLKVTFWGLRASRSYAVSLGLVGEGETVWSDSVNYTTPALSDELPPLTVLVSEPAAMEPGVTLVSLSRYNDDETETDNDFTLLVVVDAEGEVVWYYLDSAGSVDDSRRLKNGNFLFARSVLETVEMDPAGDIKTIWRATGKVPGIGKGFTRMDVDSFHHEAYAIDDDNFLVLASSLVVVDDFPTSEDDPDAPTETANVVADVIVEYNRDGEIKNQIHLSDIFDTTRIGYDSLNGFWDALYSNVEGGTHDWSHSNAIIHDPHDNNLILSMRHQDTVAKLNRDTGEIIWILSVNEDWGELSDKVLKPIGNTTPPYHAHAPEITKHGTLFLHDNGNYRARPYEDKLPTTENTSRAIEFRIDEKAMTYEQVWVFEGDSSDSFMTAFVGDVDYMQKTGNVLITQGGITEKDGVATDNAFDGHHRAAVWEVTHEKNPRVLFHMQIGDKDTDSRGWYAYRSEKLSDW